MGRTPYSDPEAEKAYQDMSDGSSKPSFDQTFDDANKSNNDNYTLDRQKALIDTGIFKRHEGAFPPGKK